MSESIRVGHLVARVAGGITLVGASLLVLRPFLVPIAWASIVAYVTWPAYTAMCRKLGRPRFTAALFTLGVALGVGIPLAWLLVALANQGTQLVTELVDWVNAGTPLPAFISERSWLLERWQELRARPVVDPAEVAKWAAGFGSRLSGSLVDLAGGIARNVFAFGLMCVTLFVFYTDGSDLVQHARRVARVIFPNAPESFVENIGHVVRAVVFGLLGTAIVQGVLAGTGFALFGVPSPVALGAVTTAVSFLPGGPVFVWGGATIWLIATGSAWYMALGMALWGAGIISSVDNVLRPILISSGPVRVPFLIVFFGVLGGLAAFGVLGLFLGPVLLSVTFALLVEFARADGGTVPAESLAPTAPQSAAAPPAG